MFRFVCETLLSCLPCPVCCFPAAASSLHRPLIFLQQPCISQEAFTAGHAAALDIYRDPPKTYNYPKGSPYV